MFHSENDPMLAATQRMYDSLEHTTLRNPPPEQREAAHSVAIGTCKDALALVGTDSKQIQTNRSTIVNPKGEKN
jgi:hypothetical protein